LIITNNVLAQQSHAGFQTKKFTYNENVFSSKKHYISSMVRTVRETGGSECWVLNKHYLEIYHFKGTQISDFDVQIDLNNALEQEHVFTGIFVLHMKDHILSLLDEVPGKVYLKKIECYRELYDTLNKKFTKTKILRIKNELAEKIEFIEEEFPQFII
jgi:hypothetical protein